ncbi:MAG TPA: YlxR family protein [Streptosporangiaceae bacterium]|nr:YlxR family protein [Streptosporangiaceae bacterium]
MRSSSLGMSGSVIRTCVGCKTRAVKSDLLRVVAVDGEIVVDSLARRPGRGAYLHPSQECLEQARRRRAFPRALRVTGPLTDEGLARYLALA